MTLSDITFFEGKELGILKDASIFRQLISNYDQLDQAQRILLLLNKLVQDPDDCNKAVKLLESFEWSDNYLKSANLFILKMLAILGFIGNIDECNSCGAKFNRDKVTYLDKESLLFLCQNCAKSKKKYVKVSGMGLDLFASILDSFVEKF
jgi:recombinational DNA repair protein (RecF pathway)